MELEAEPFYNRVCKKKDQRELEKNKGITYLPKSNNA